VNLNHIFLFLAVISPLLVLGRAWRQSGGQRGWRVAAWSVLAVTAVSWFLLPDRAGYIGGGAWFALLFLPAIGLRKTTDLFMQHRYAAARRLAVALHLLHPTAELRDQVRLLRSLEARQREGDLPAVRNASDRTTEARPSLHLTSAPAVLLFASLNVIVFLIEMVRGGWGHPVVLYRLGAFDPYAVLFEHQYWRLLTALFLHYNVIHISFNLFALYVLGPSLERTIGSMRFAICYLLSGLGSTGGVLLLTVLQFTRPSELVGASGCIMGVVGAWAGFLIRHRHLPQARERLLNILLIVAIQTAFDLSTPEVSMGAHVCGLITGFCVGLLVAPRRRMPV
jgi:membrane associated rhomboid family serine protease